MTQPSFLVSPHVDSAIRYKKLKKNFSPIEKSGPLAGGKKCRKSEFL